MTAGVDPEPLGDSGRITWGVMSAGSLGIKVVFKDRVRRSLRILASDVLGIGRDGVSRILASSAVEAV